MGSAAATAALAPTALRRVRRLLDEGASPLTGRRVLALCSGGADSVALVALLGRLPAGAAPRSIDVLWLDHGLRDGEGVARERAAARSAAASVGAACHERRCELDLRSDPRGVEAAARAWRLGTAVEVARELSCDAVCTGHTASDQLEQALLALVGVTGRGGDVDAMPVARPLGDGLLLVRPLLALSRAHVERCCDELGLAWGADPSNDDPDAHVRNAVRARVVPELVALHDGAGAAIARAGRRRKEQLDATSGLADALLDAWSPARDAARLDARRLAPLPPPARRALLVRWLAAAHPARDVGARIVDAVEQLATAPARAACARVDLPGAACVRRDGYDLVIVPDPARQGPPS